MLPQPPLLEPGLGTGGIAIFVAIGLVYLLGEAGLPFPWVSQGVLFYFGYLVARGSTHLLLPLLAAVLAGSLGGSAALYFLARRWGSPLLLRYGRHLRLKPESLDRAGERLGGRMGFLSVAIGRLTPGLLVPTSLASGLLRLPFRLFVAGVVLSEVAWNGAFLTLGAVAGRHVTQLDAIMSELPLVLGLFVGVALAFGALLLWWWRRAAGPG